MWRTTETGKVQSGPFGGNAMYLRRKKLDPSGDKASGLMLQKEDG